MELSSNMIWAENFFESDPHMASLLNLIPDAIFICDDHGNIVYTNNQITQLTQYKSEELKGKKIEVLVPDSLRQEHVRLRNAYIQEPKMREMGRGLNLYITNKSGIDIPVDISLSPLQTPDGLLVLALVRDISDKKAAELSLTEINEKLQSLAHHDVLTGLPNRLYLYDTLKIEFSRAERHHHNLTFLFIDLDNFKVINDTHGHETGDEILRQAAQRLKANLRTEDFVARLGGDEFAVILMDMPNSQADIVAQKLIESCQAPFDIHGESYEIGASIGIASKTDNMLPETLIHQADSAMYLAKTAGRNCFKHYKPTQDNQ